MKASQEHMGGRGQVVTAATAHAESVNLVTITQPILHILVPQNMPATEGVRNSLSTAADEFS